MPGGFRTPAELYEETITLPRALQFPVELRHRRGSTRGGDTQQDTVTEVVISLGAWVRAHPDFVLGKNEAGMHLAGETRAADAAIWRTADLGAYRGGLRRVAPVLAVEVAGIDGDPEAALIDKAAWYLARGVAAVVVVLRAGTTARLAVGDRILEIPELPGLSLPVAELFTQLDRAR